MRWSQLRTIFWLRWRLTRNQWSRSGPLDVVISMIAVAGVLVIGAVGGIVGVLAGALGLAKASPLVMLGVWDAIIGAFLLFWMIGIVSEIQRSETIDVGRMQHLPISLRDIFLINYLASHLTFSIIMFLPGMVGLSVGLILGRGWSMIWLLLGVLGFVFMITAWTYYLRGWLVALMVNPRRRRAIIAGITLGFILVCQLPHFFLRVARHRRRHQPSRVESVQSEQQPTAQPEGGGELIIPRTVLLTHKFVPFLWVGNGAMSLATGNPWAAVLGAAGAFGLGGLGLRQAYRATLRFYRGQATDRRTVRRAKRSRAAIVKGNFLERNVPGVPEEAGALGLAFFRSLTRASEVKMALATNFVMLLIFGGAIFLRRLASIGDNIKPFVATGAIAFTFFGMSQLMFNQFGFDRAGFRTLILMPVPRRRILLGKNLAVLPVAMGIGSAFLAVVMFALRMSLVIVLAAALQLVATFLLLSTVGNLTSVLVPYRIAPGSLKPTKVSATTTLLIFLSHMLFPTAMIPIFLPAFLGLLMSRLSWIPAAPGNLLLSVVVLALAALLYWLSLAGLGELLQRRERRILQVVTQEVE